MSKDYYKILGVNKDASDKEIKSKYRKLSLKYHPDKQGDKSEAEQKEAEEKFKDINEAYQVLSDPTKRKNYDTTGDPDRSFNMNDNFGYGNFSSMADMFNSAFGGSRFNASNMYQYVEPNGYDRRAQVALTIEEIFNGCTKKLKYKRNIRCKNCHGDGGTGKKICPHCGGSGSITQKRQTPMGWMVVTDICPHCKGKGSIVENVCPTCNGSGFNQEDHIVEVKFAPGVLHGMINEYPGEGDESRDPKKPNGSLLTVAYHNYDQSKYEIINNYDVVEHIHLPYYDLLLGRDYEIEMPDKSKKRIKIKECTNDGSFLRMSGAGIKLENSNKADYYVVLHADYPEKLSDKEKENLEKIKELNKK